jgi:hypothetical protein
VVERARAYISAAVREMHFRMTRLLEQGTPLSLPFLLIVMFARWTVIFLNWDIVMVQ